ncbi:DUF3275 family protein [Pseudorhodoferax sp. Leaf267]|jgi:hypothetical protein|uniref:DUF3275 family protein n=1 Tax=Pseudorhodoferax sp. Leaf267 TaxID=1736316 RepID=UPI0007159425|nr:DUF3275 family protein [Pseudorhodoferax sp. Leaf267]KQP14802.1 hypothetical protein ASF43_12100 [Pseudorhodoferax sp. Leaf267]
MIKIENTTLRVRKIRQSRNGPFTVADLSTDIGEFRVKDQLLDAFDEGEYQATVWISEIYLKQYVAYGRGVTELRAQLHEVQIEAAAELEGEPEPIEPDPIDETIPERVGYNQTAQAEERESAAAVDISALKAKLKGVGRRKSKAVASVESAAPANALVDLFGEEVWSRIQGREPVKLDSTVDRARFREQIRTLSTLDYQFNPMEQTFMPVDLVS